MMDLLQLSNLGIGTVGTIVSLDDNHAKLKLMEMGCISGEEVCIENIAPLGDPIAIRIAGYCLSIRKSEASCIWIKLNK